MLGDTTTKVDLIAWTDEVERVDNQLQKNKTYKCEGVSKTITERQTKIYNYYSQEVLKQLKKKKNLLCNVH